YTIVSLLQVIWKIDVALCNPHHHGKLQCRNQGIGLIKEVDIEGAALCRKLVPVTHHIITGKPDGIASNIIGFIHMDMHLFLWMGGAPVQERIDHLVQYRLTFGEEGTGE